jgi:hypothetical protein
MQMNKKLVGGLIGLAVLGVSTAAAAHVDLTVGVGIPATVYAAPEPVYGSPPPPAFSPAYVVPAPVAVGYWHRDNWREREWRRHEWREHQSREQQSRDRHGW